MIAKPYKWNTEHVHLRSSQVAKVVAHTSQRLNVKVGCVSLCSIHNLGTHSDINCNTLFPSVLAMYMTYLINE